MSKLILKYIVFAIFCIFSSYKIALAQYRLPLLQEKRIVLDGINAPIDNFDLDIKGQRAFIVCESNNTLYVVNLNDGSIMFSQDQFNKPKAVVYISSSNSLFVCNSGDGICRMMDANKFTVKFNVILAKKADNIFYDPISMKIYVAHSRAISVVDASNGKILANYKLPGHPDSFVFDHKRSLIFATIASKGTIEVIDYAKSEIKYSWKLKDKRNSYGLTIDHAGNKLFTASQRPSEFHVLGTYTGRIMASLKCSEDATDMHYDAYLRRIYVSSPTGYIHVFKQNANDGFETMAKIPTMDGAKKMMHVPVLNRVYLAVPGSSKDKAELLIYKIQN